MKHIYNYFILFGIILISNSASSQVKKTATAPPAPKSQKTKTPKAVIAKPTKVDSIVVFLQAQKTFHDSMKINPKNATALLIKESALFKSINSYLQKKYPYGTYSRNDIEDISILYNTMNYINADCYPYEMNPYSLKPSASQEENDEVAGLEATIQTLLNKLRSSDSANLKSIKTGVYNTPYNPLVLLLEKQSKINNTLTTLKLDSLHFLINTNKLLLDSARSMIILKAKPTPNDSSKNMILRSIVAVGVYDSILCNMYSTLTQAPIQKKAPDKHDSLIKTVNTAMKLFSKDTLNQAIKLVENSLSFERKLGNRISDTTKDSIKLSEIKLALYPPTDTLAKQVFQFSGAAYNNINNVRDNDPPGLSQYYLYVSMPLHKKNGIIIDTLNKSFNQVIGLRNVFFQATYSPQAYKYDSIITTVPSERLVNRLDLLQYAALNFTMSLNALTIIVPDDGNSPSDLIHIYLDGIAGFLITNDSINSTTATNRKSIPISSSLWGINLAVTTEKAISKNLTFSVQAKIFQILPFTSSVDPILNPQLHNFIGGDTALQSNSSKAFTRQPNPLYFNIDGLVSTNLLSKLIPSSGSSNTSGNLITLFLHADVFSDFANNSHKYDNTYFQIQLGTALNF